MLAKGLITHADVCVRGGVLQKCAPVSDGRPTSVMSVEFGAGPASKRYSDWKLLARSPSYSRYPVTRVAGESARIRSSTFWKCAGMSNPTG